MNLEIGKTAVRWARSCIVWPQFFFFSFSFIVLLFLPSVQQMYVTRTQFFYKGIIYTWSIYGDKYRIVGNTVLFQKDHFSHYFSESQPIDIRRKVFRDHNERSPQCLSSLNIVYRSSQFICISIGSFVVFKITWVCELNFYQKKVLTQKSGAGDVAQR